MILSGGRCCNDPRPYGLLFSPMRIHCHAVPLNGVTHITASRFKRRLNEARRCFAKRKPFCRNRVQIRLDFLHLRLLGRPCRPITTRLRNDPRPHRQIRRRRQPAG